MSQRDIVEQELLELVASEADELATHREMAHIERIMREGTGADRQLAAHERTQDVTAVSTEIGWSDIGKIEEFVSLTAPAKRLIKVEQRDASDWNPTANAISLMRRFEFSRRSQVFSNRVHAMYSTKFTPVTSLNFSLR